jgi:hypothetical protein
VLLLTSTVFCSTWLGHPNFELVRGDVVEPLLVEVDQVRPPPFLPLRHRLTLFPFADLPPRLPRLPESIPEERCQDDEDVVHGNDELPWDQQAVQGSIFAQFDFRSVLFSLSSSLDATDRLSLALEQRSTALPKSTLNLRRSS